MSDRRNPFGQIPDASPTASPPDIFESLPVAEIRQRDRAWERRHLNKKVVYRGIDPYAALRVREIADELNVPTGEVARALLEYGLDAYSHGEMDLTPRPNPARLRMTLYPSDDVPVQKTGRKSKRETTPEQRWRVITTWRNFSPELKHEIGVLASDEGLDVPVGELVSAFLQYALKVYDAGNLELQPVVKTTRYSLALGGDF